MSGAEKGKCLIMKRADKVKCLSNEWSKETYMFNK